MGQFIINHFLKQFKEETIQGMQPCTCGEPWSAVCNKMNKGFKKDYEPYQVMGPIYHISYTSFCFVVFFVVRRYRMHQLFPVVF